MAYWMAIMCPYTRTLFRPLLQRGVRGLTKKDLTPRMRGQKHTKVKIVKTEDLHSPLLLGISAEFICAGIDFLRKFGSEVASTVSMVWAFGVHGVPTVLSVLVRDWSSSLLPTV